MRKVPWGRGRKWIKLYGLLTGQLDTAEQFFEKSVQQVQAVEKETKNQGKRNSHSGIFLFHGFGLCKCAHAG